MSAISAGEEGGGTRRRQCLKVLSHGLYTAVLIHTLWEFSLSLYPLGSSFPSVTLNLERSRYAEVMADRIAAGLEEALSTLSLDKSALGLLLLATQASLEQGYAGTVFRDNVLSDVNFPLAEYLRERLHLPVYVCNYAYAHVLCMYHSPNVRVSDALYFSCGERSVALGIFIDGKIVMGPRNTFPECSHLPFPYGFEASLGSYGPHTARALTFAVGALAPEHKAIISAMAEAVRSVVGNRQLITAHTQGGRSLWDMLEEPSYLDFLTWQSGHMGRYYPSWRNIEADYARTPLPVLDAEPCYESHPVMNEYTFSRSDSASRFTDREVRRTSYWTVFSGAAGITYGCYAIWQMHREEDENVEIPESAASAYRNDTIPFWHRSLNFPGAFQIPVLRRFMENLPHAETVKPDNSLILSDNPKGEGHCCALTNEERDFVAVYVPSHAPVTVDVSAFGYDGFVIYWFDPRYEIYNRLSDDNSETKFLTMTPPASGGDFVLLLVRKGVPFNAR